MSENHTKCEKVGRSDVLILQLMNFYTHLSAGTNIKNIEFNKAYVPIMPDSFSQHCKSLSRIMGT